MGLFRTVTYAGLEIPDVYARISRLNGGKELLTIQLDHYRDKEGFLSKDLSAIKTEYYDFVPSVDVNAPNFILQGYLHLKTLSAFDDTLDDLE